VGGWFLYLDNIYRLGDDDAKSVLQTLLRLFTLLLKKEKFLGEFLGIVVLHIYATYRPHISYGYENFPPDMTTRVVTDNVARLVKDNRAC